MPASITLLTSAGAVRVEGENLVIDIRNITEYPGLPSHAGEDGHPHPSSEAGQVKDVQGVRVPSIPVHSEQETASALQDRNEPVSDSGASVTNSHSAPSKAETGRAGGPVCAPVTNQEHAGCRDDRHDLAADAGSRVRSGLGIGNAGWNSNVRNRGQSTPKPLRPHCLHPELCRSGTREHCHSCRKQMAESEVAA